MAAVVFGGTYLGAAAIHSLVMSLAVGERARAFKGVSPGLLPPLGIIFGLLVAFVAAQVWSDVDRANTAVNREASALRAVVLLSGSFPEEAQDRRRGRLRPVDCRARSTVHRPRLGSTSGAHAGAAGVAGL
jgi:hypothetical protein